MCGYKRKENVAKMRLKWHERLLVVSALPGVLDRRSDRWCVILQEGNGHETD